MKKSPAERLKRKNQIIKLFKEKVKGKSINIKGMNIQHHGHKGHWLEKKMGVKHNSSNKPDLLGFEMKNHTSSKTSFGDWSASYYLFKCRNNPEGAITKDRFLRIFGKKNIKKQGRFSWSGEPCPNINSFNNFGQKLVIKDKSITAIYNFKKDKRINKHSVVPNIYQNGNVILACWDHLWMKKKVEDKFNNYGWFKCRMDKKGVYTKISFGNAFNYTTWLKLVVTGEIFLDSGMSQRSSRNRSNWRAYNKIWDKLIKETF